MKATKEQIIAEANRRRAEHGEGAPPVEHFIVDVVCENWTPPEPEPVNPDILAFREWAAERWPVSRSGIEKGGADYRIEAKAYLAGARMAREQERERAKPLVDQAKAIIDQHARLLARLPLGLRADIGIEWQTMMDTAASFYAKYRGEA